MRRALTPFAEANTYGALGFLVSALPLGVVWLVLLITGWALALGLAVTPLVVPVLLGLGWAIRASAAVEAALSRHLLGSELRPSTPLRAPAGFWGQVRSVLTDASLWRAQAYLGIRATVGLGLASLLAGLIAAGAFLLVSPAFFWAIPHGIDVGAYRAHTLLECLPLVPVGALVLIATIRLAGPLADFWRTLSVALLSDAPAPAEGRAQVPDSHRRAVAIQADSHRRAVAIQAAVTAGVNLMFVVIWAVTSRGYFWPVWTILALGLPLAINAWVASVRAHPAWWAERRLSPGFGIHAGVWAAILLFFICIWAVTSRGYFWPVWPLLPALVALGAHGASLLLRSPDRAALTERISTLESSRAGAVDVQEAELQRIERDLHDGAQARLVALGMSLGMAEQKLATDPDAARELLAEAREGTGEALRELRHLARGIHPPVLADRGLEAAVRALAAASPIPVAVSVSSPDRPKPPVESAAYFVVAEALANAGKHADAHHVGVRIDRVGDVLSVEIDDDGVGGANASGSGLTGLRRRVEALDGTLSVSSPPGGPTTVRAELPCG